MILCFDLVKWKGAWIFSCHCTALYVCDKYTSWILNWDGCILFKLPWIFDITDEDKLMLIDVFYSVVWRKTSGQQEPIVSSKLMVLILMYVHVFDVTALMFPFFFFCSVNCFIIKKKLELYVENVSFAVYEHTHRHRCSRSFNMYADWITLFNPIPDIWSPTK